MTSDYTCTKFRVPIRAGGREADRFRNRQLELSPSNALFVRDLVEKTGFTEMFAVHMFHRRRGSDNSVVATL